MVNTNKNSENMQIHYLNFCDETPGMKKNI